MRIEGMLARWAVAAVAAWASCAQAAPSADEARQAWREAGEAATQGPADVALAGEAVLHLPADEVFVPRTQAARLLAVMGNPGPQPDLQGLVLSKEEQAHWFMVVEWKAAGYVKDDDAKDWNADELLESYRKGTAAGNEERARMGVPALEIVGWAEPPRYDPATQRLAWAMSSREVGAPADAERSVNYNTYALGREGYFEMNLVAGLPELPQLKPVAARLLGALQFNDGKRYADFDARTDHVAEYGLAALVVGVAAKKLGLLALGAAFFAKFAKVILIALAAFGGGFLKLFRRKPEPAAAAAPGPAAQPAPAPAPAAAVEPHPQPGFEHTVLQPPPDGDFPSTFPVGLDGPNPPRRPGAA